MAKKPNIILFVADQMRADALGHMGNQAAITPNLNEVVRTDGVSFQNAYCQNNVCVPSRCSFLTGWYPHTKGHRTMHYLLEKDDPMLLKTLKQQGYEVLWLGRNDVIPADRDLSEYCDEYYSGNVEGQNFTKNGPQWQAEFRGNPNQDNYYSFLAGKAEEPNRFTNYDWNCVERALNYIETYPSDSEKPFCIYITLLFPHPPYVCEDPWFSSIDRKLIQDEDIRPIPDWSQKASILKAISDKQGIKDWNIERKKEIKATYYAMVSRLDHHYGMLMNALKKKALYDDTAVFMFSDHGDYTGDYGIVEKTQNTFENPVNNVPFIIKPPKNIAVKPRISKALVELVDLCATIADLANFDLDYTQFGKSLLPVLEGQEYHKDAVFSEGGRIHGETQAMELGHGPESLYWPRLSTQASEGPEHTKAVMIRMGSYKYIERLYEKNELYDLEKDKYELTNLIDDAQYNEFIMKMRERLLQFYMETADFVPNRKDKR
jgi:arylsulfatase A-like enzyme